MKKENIRTLLMFGIKPLSYKTKYRGDWYQIEIIFKYNDRVETFSDKYRPRKETSKGVEKRLYNLLVHLFIKSGKGLLEIPIIPIYMSKHLKDMIIEERRNKTESE